MLAFAAFIDRPCVLEILRSVNHAYQLNAVFERDIEHDMGLSGKTPNPLFLNFRPVAPHQWLLGQIAGHIIESPQIAIGTRLAGVVGDVTPNLDEILTSSRSANDPRHGYARR